MTKKQHQLLLKYSFAREAQQENNVFKIRSEYTTEEVLQELNREFGFNILERPDKVSTLLQEAITSHNSDDVESALQIVGIAGYSPCFLPMLITLLELPWHRSHEDIVVWFEYLKAPESVEVLYRTALVEHAYRDYDETFGLARRCTYALQKVGTVTALEKVRLLAHCENTKIAQHAQERIDNW